MKHWCSAEKQHNINRYPCGFLLLHIYVEALCSLGVYNRKMVAWYGKLPIGLMQWKSLRMTDHLITLHMSWSRDHHSMFLMPWARSDGLSLLCPSDTRYIHTQRSLPSTLLQIEHVSLLKIFQPIVSHPSAPASKGGAPAIISHVTSAKERRSCRVT